MAGMESSPSGTTPLRKLCPRNTNEAKGEALMNLLGMLPVRSLWSRYKVVSAGALSKAGSVPFNLGPGLKILSADNSCSLGNDPISDGIEPEKRLPDTTVKKKWHGKYQVPGR